MHHCVCSLGGPNRRRNLLLVTMARHQTLRSPVPHSAIHIAFLAYVSQSIKQAKQISIAPYVANVVCLARLKMYKCLRGLAPDYLTRLSVRPRLRSSDDHQLLIPQTHTVTLGTCTFNTSGPASWNALPAVRRDPAVILGTFRQMLKSFLFWLTDVYRPWYSCRSTRLCDVC